MGIFGWIFPERKERKADTLLAEAIAVYQRAAMRQARLADIDRGLRTSAQAREFYTELGKKDGEVRSYNIQGGLYRCARRLADSIECEQKALDIVCVIAPDSESVAQGLNNLAGLNREAYLPVDFNSDIRSGF